MAKKKHKKPRDEAFGPFCEQIREQTREQTRDFFRESRDQMQKFFEKTDRKLQLTTQLIEELREEYKIARLQISLICLRISQIATTFKINYCFPIKKHLSL